nr:uncharacterized protein LOC122322184 [Drosophila bipectinata]XP_043069593.1 uncharacterized protein LOC122322185 [Drosophila bipectinata]
MNKFVKITSTSNKKNDDDGQHATKRKRETSMVWQVFKKCKDSNTAICNQCGKQYKTGGNTTNPMDHLKRIHPALLKEQPLEKEKSLTKFLERDTLYSNTSEKKTH